MLIMTNEEKNMKTKKNSYEIIGFFLAKSYITICQSSPVENLNIFKMAMPKFSKLPSTSLNKNTPKTAKIKYIKNKRRSTLKRAGKEKIKVLIILLKLWKVLLFISLKSLVIRITQRTQAIWGYMVKALISKQ